MKMTYVKYICFFLTFSAMPTGLFAQSLAENNHGLGALKKSLLQLEGQSGDVQKTINELLAIGLREHRERIHHGFKGSIAKLTAVEQKNRDLAIDALQKLVKRYPDELNLAPTSMFLLGNLLYDRLDAQFAEDGTLSKADLQQIIALYENVIQRFPKFEAIESVYFVLGIVFMEHDDAAKGIAIWKALIERHPSSKYMDELRFRIGNHYFDEREFNQAIANFEPIASNRKSDYYEKASYKLAWTYYLVNRIREAIDGFVQVLNLSSASGGAASASVLESESKQYLAICFAEMPEKEVRGTASEQEISDGTAHYQFAKTYFKTLGKPSFERDVFALLGDLLTKYFRPVGAELSYLHAVRINPHHAENPLLLERAYKGLVEGGSLDRALEVRKKIVADFSSTSRWYSLNRRRKETRALKESRRIVRESLIWLANFAHERARKLKESDLALAVEAYQEAALRYAQYIRLYPTQDDIDEQLFLLGDAAFEAKQYAASLQAYAQVRDWPLGTKHREEAALNGLFALEALIREEQENKQLPAFDLSSIKLAEAATTPAAILPRYQQYIEAVALLQKISSNANDLPAFLYRAAAVDFYFGHQATADAKFGQIIETYPQSNAAKLAGNLRLERSIASLDWAGVRNLARHYQDINLGNEGGDFLEVEQKARFKIASVLFSDAEKQWEAGLLSEARTKFAQAAHAYLDLLKDNPKYEFADRILYNVVIAWLRNRDLDQAESALRRLHLEFPNGDFSRVALWQLAQSHENRLDFKKAAEIYRSFAQSFSAADQAADAQLNVGVLYEASQDYILAAKAFLEFARHFPSRSEATPAWFKAAGLFGKAKELTLERKTLQEMMQFLAKNPDKRDDLIEASMQLAELEQNPAQRAKDYALVLRYFKPEQASPKARYFVAKAAFELVNIEFGNFSKMKIDAKKGKAQTAQLVAKSKKLAELQKSYEEVVVRYEQPQWGVASLYQIGLLYEGLFRSLLDAPCPSDVASVDEVACDEYRNLLEDKAFVLEEKAVSSFKLSYEKATTIATAKDWLFPLREALNRMRPGEYPVPDEPTVFRPVGDIDRLGIMQGGQNEP